MSRNLSPPKQDVIGDESTSSVLSKLAGSSPVTGKIGLEYLPSSLETTAGAQAKADAAQASAIAAAAIDVTIKTATKANLTGGNVFIGNQQNSGIVTSSAALGTDPKQLPTQAQVRTIIAPAYVEPLVDYHFAAWSGTGTLASRGLKTVQALTMHGTPSEVETPQGLSRQFTNVQRATVDAGFFVRLHQGLAVTMVIEGQTLMPHTAGTTASLIGLDDIFSVDCVGFQLRYEPSGNGTWLFGIRRNNTTIEVVSVTSIHTVANAPLVRVIISGSSTTGYSIKYILANGNILTSTIAANAVPVNSDPASRWLSINYNGRDNNAYGTTTIRRIRLYDQILDI